MSELAPRFEQRLEDKATLGPKPLPTAGAIPVKDEKGNIVMKRVKVSRYVAGQEPKYAGDKSSESSDDDFTRRDRTDKSERSHRHRDSSEEHDNKHHRTSSSHRHKHQDDKDRRSDSDTEHQKRRDENRDRHIKQDRDEEPEEIRRHDRLRHRRREEEEEAPIEEENLSDSDDEFAAQRRRDEIKMRQRHREIKEDVESKHRDQLKRARQQEEEEILKREQEGISDEEKTEEESSEEEDSESEEEDNAPMLKPVFVKKRDRVTLLEAEEENRRLEQLRLDEEKRRDERKKDSARILEETLKREEEMKKTKNEDRTDLASVNTDDENEQISFEQWKIREIRRLKRNRDEREALAREKSEIEKIHSMTEEERKEYLRLNPKIVTNKAQKGKYKYLQKYYHRGAFYLDQEDDIFKRDFAEATGEDEFDKMVLPKVMQVKNFGKASRSKWTHLTAEDTTDHQGIWATETAQSAKFLAKQAAGMKNVFDRPSTKKRRIGE